MKRLIFGLLLVLFVASTAARPQTHQILGAKIYRPVREAKELVEFAKSLGLNTLFVGDELGGSVSFREECRKAGLKYFLILRTFNDPEAGERDPSLVSIDRQGRPGRRAGDAMICPSRADFRRQKAERIRAAIRRLMPDGVTLDYFRFFIYWEGVDPQTGPVDFPAYCFDRSCLEEFRSSGGEKLRHTVAGDTVKANRQLIDEIWSEHREAWYRWRVQRIAENAREFTEAIRKEFPDLPIVLHAVPWMRDEFDGAREKIVGQDFRLLAPFFDYVSPMAYSALTRRGTGWIANLNQSLLTEIPKGKLLPSIEVGPDAPTFPPMPLAQYESDLKAARKTPAGVVLYHLELLLDEPEKQAITKRLLALSR